LILQYFSTILKNKKRYKNMLTIRDAYYIIILASRLERVENLENSHNAARERALSASSVNRNEFSGYSAAWLARLIWDQEVAGSNPVTPTEQPVYILQIGSVNQVV
jgi:hypothetical protein